MKVTKYPQSCLKIEKNGHAILVDVGSLATAQFTIEDFGKFEAVLFTHRHVDHLDLDAIDDLLATGATIYGNADVAEAVGGERVEVIDDGEELVVAGFKIKSFHMEHCLMVDGSKGVPNTGFLIDEVLLLPGDSTESTGIKVKYIALPIFGPDISFHDAFGMAEAYSAEIVLPVHYDVSHMDPSVFNYFSQHVGERSGNFKVEVIPNGESVELSV